MSDWAIQSLERHGFYNNCIPGTKSFVPLKQPISHV